MPSHDHRFIQACHVTAALRALTFAAGVRQLESYTRTGTGWKGRYQCTTHTEAHLATSKVLVHCSKTLPERGFVHRHCDSAPFRSEYLKMAH